MNNSGYSIIAFLNFLTYEINQCLEDINNSFAIIKFFFALGEKASDCLSFLFLMRIVNVW